MLFCVRSMLYPIRQLNRNVCPVIQLKNNPVTSIKPYKIIYKQYSVHSVEDESGKKYIKKIIDDICRGDAALEKKLKILMLEVDVMQQDGQSVPDHLEMKHWQHLLELSRRNQRIKYLMYLKNDENQKAKKKERKKKFLESPPETTREYPDDLMYSLRHQSLFLGINEQSMNKFYNYRALQAMQHGQSVVLDCSYDEHMIYTEAVDAAKQMCYVFGDNRVHKEPFNIHLCHVKWDGPFMRQLEAKIPTLTEPWFPMNIHTDSYLDIFPREKLVYLTPHCREELTTFDHDAIYIVGCMVDKVNRQPLSLAKAKRDGIKVAKLPLDRYLKWGPGPGKTMKINHMISILLDIKQTGDWEYAFKHVPRRKLMATTRKIMNTSLQSDLNNLNEINKFNFREKNEYYLSMLLTMLYKKKI